MSILKLVQYGFALPTAMFLVASFARAQERSEAPAIVTRYCSGCHGMDGRSQLPYIPRLAGMGVQYLETKFASYQEAPAAPVDEAFNKIAHIGNSNKPMGLTGAANVNMVGVAHFVSEEDKDAAIGWYASRPPAPGKNRKGKAIEEGRKLFINGLPSRGLYACQACHGANGQGTDTVPRLAGQNADYLIGQLAVFRAGERRLTMTDIARRLEDNEVRAVAAYLQSR
jgi:cytochrome c553